MSHKHADALVNAIIAFGLVFFGAFTAVQEIPDLPAIIAAFAAGALAGFIRLQTEWNKKGCVVNLMKFI